MEGFTRCFMSFSLGNNVCCCFIPPQPPQLASCSRERKKTFSHETKYLLCVPRVLPQCVDPHFLGNNISTFCNRKNPTTTTIHTEVKWNENISCSFFCPSSMCVSHKLIRFIFSVSESLSLSGCGVETFFILFYFHEKCVESRNTYSRLVESSSLQS